MKQLLVLLLTITLFGCQTSTNETLLFVGSYTDKQPGEGIHVYQFNNETGESVLKFTLDSITNTSFLKLSDNGEYLYSVVESQMPHHGKVASFKVDAKNQKIELLNMQDCGGLNPVHLQIDHTGNYLTNSNYSDGSLSLFKINKDGSLNEASQVLKFKDSSIIKGRQDKSHIHSSYFSPDNKYLFTQDLGADKMRRFSFSDKDKGLLENEMDIKAKLGSGPRHFAFHPNGKFGYLANELSGKVDAYQYVNGDLVFIEDYLSYGQQQDIYRTADIHTSPDGKFLYVSNRGPEEDTITVFQINQDNGKLTLVERTDTGGQHPRNFAIHPSGKYLLVTNMFTDNVVVFRRDIETGKLTKLDKEIKVKTPSSVQIFTYAISE
ncbi:lactonase family protein [Hyunsoonleella sp. SJ7]|uniref:Lactonase family protein n=1 Tax=Hyunsoonleella aquatilis TaxID=2762758 RepID=A0A923HEF8_9FLAO|nr:lactonase family protein [Hyunsoonleella aquatilis]MBC3758728.1 lactonase family protein [Hyunsoonleella aquatilis]